MTVDHELEALRRSAAAISRCPIATALWLEAHEQAVFCFDERRYLLLEAATVCSQAVIEGRDLRHDGPGDAIDVAQIIRFAKD